MPYKCSAYGCHSGYDTQEEEREGISFHKFPVHDKERLQRWISRNPRKDFKVTSYSRLCSLHFVEEDFITGRTDSNERRSKNLTGNLTRRRLKDTAIPSVFPNAPSYLSTSSTSERSTSASSEKRLKRSAEILESKSADFLSSDNLTSFNDLKQRLNSEDLCIPSGYVIQTGDDLINLLYVITDCYNIPRLKACVTIQNNMDVSVVVGDKILSKSLYSDITPTSTLGTFSQTLNLMARANRFLIMMTTPFMTMQKM